MATSLLKAQRVGNSSPFAPDFNYSMNSPSLTIHGTQNNHVWTPANLGLDSRPSAYPAPYQALAEKQRSFEKPTNIHTISQSQTTDTVSPHETCFDQDDWSPIDDILFYDGFPRETKRNDSIVSAKNVERRESLCSNSSTVGLNTQPKRYKRRRGTEDVEPGSARALYLEKNRRAATKCRGKQKQQQEELVDTAREVERRNKLLKGEVEFLQADMHDLMEMVGQHANCPDKRLRTYVERGAHRWATAQRIPIDVSACSDDSGLPPAERSPHVP